MILTAVKVCETVFEVKPKILTLKTKNKKIIKKIKSLEVLFEFPNFLYVVIIRGDYNIRILRTPPGSVNNIIITVRNP